MISPDFKGFVPSNYSGPTKEYVKKHHGDDLWTSLEPYFTEIENVKKEFPNAQAFGCDVE